MFLILTFDFQNSNDVNIVCLTKNLEKATVCYQRTVEKYVFYNLQSKNCLLIELIEIPDEFDDVNGYNFFWGIGHPDVKVIKSNINTEEFDE
jgi:hypothetical protein